MKKGIMQVMLANVLCMLISIATNFILPRYLSIETYNVIKSYTLYISYAGLFAFGYTDGIYLKYGGSQITTLNKDELNKDSFTYFVFQTFIFILILFGAILRKNDLFIVFSIGLLATNLGGYFKILYQATGVFGKYGMALNLEKIVVFFVNIFFVFLLRTDASSFYLVAQILGPIITFGYLFHTYKEYCRNYLKPKFSFSALYKNIKSGFILTIGGVADIFFTGLDRWFIKILMGIREFSLYSFAVSLENIISTFTAPISITLYNYFCKGLNNKTIRRIKSVLLLFGFLLLAAVFPIKWIVDNYIKSYVDSIDVILFLFIAQFFYMIIRSIYVNLYKARKKQDTYLKQIIIMLLVAFTTNALFYLTDKKIESFALATCLTSVLWFLWCELKHSEIRYNLKEYLCIIVALIVCFLCKMFLPTILGFLIYLMIVVILTFIFLRNTIMYCVANLKVVVKKLKCRIR